MVIIVTSLSPNIKKKELFKLHKYFIVMINNSINSQQDGSWFVQIVGAGYALAIQNPEKITNIVLVFLES
jgi:hypothetical protein